MPQELSKGCYGRENADILSLLTNTIGRHDAEFASALWGTVFTTGQGCHVAATLQAPAF